MTGKGKREGRPGRASGGHPGDQPASQQKVTAIERYVRCRHRWEGLAINADVGGVRINSDVRIGLIVEHMPLAHAPGARDRDGTAARLQPMAIVSCSRSRRNKIDAETGSGEPVPTPVGGVEEWLALRDGRIALAEGPPGDVTALDHQFWLHTEKFRLPQHD